MRKSQVVQQLCFHDFSEFRDRLDLQNNSALYNDIRYISADILTAIFKRIYLLTFHEQTGMFEFQNESPFIRCFQQAGTQRTVYGECCI